MPTDDEVRTLLAKAAATIEVDESAPMTLAGLPEPRPRRWPVLAAVAAVVLAIGGGYLVSQQLGDDPQPAPADQPDVADHEPVEQEHVYADDEMPSLLGYIENEATELLSERGYSLRVEAEYSCDQPRGYVLGTDPGPGTPMVAGDRVRLRVTAGPAPNVRCAAVPDTWQQVFDLVRFARGLGPAPDFPDEVSIAMGEGEWTFLSAAEAKDPDNWILCVDGECHSALAALAETLTGPRRFLAVEDGIAGPCQLPHGQGLPYHLPSYVYGYEPTDGIFCPPLPILEVGWAENWRIASVELHLEYEEQALDTEELELSLDRASAAERFVTWARGEGPAPEFADRVRVMFSGGGAFGHTGWTDEPESRTSYSGCSGLGFPDCGIDQVALLVRYRGPVVPTAGRSTCADGGEVPERFAAAEDDVVRLEEPEPASCRSAWAVELWIDEDGVIYGVNQAGAN